MGGGETGGVDSQSYPCASAGYRPCRCGTQPTRLKRSALSVPEKGIELHNPRNTVSVRYEHAAILAPADIGLQVKAGLATSGALDDVRQPCPGLRVCSQRAHGAALGIGAVNDVIGSVHIPEIALRIEAQRMGASASAQRAP